MHNHKKVVLLLSGGFDSTVAGYLLQQQGFEIVPLHLSNVDFAGEDTIDKCKNIAKKFNWKPLYIIDIADFLQLFVDKCEHSYYFVLLKRLMLRLGSIIAKKTSSEFIATGESLGQVSSQTLKNISVIEEATEFRTLKPLITFDKEQIVQTAREIGTFDISAGPEVCDLLGPKHPVTSASLKRVKEEEKKLDYTTLLSNITIQELFP